MLEFGKQGFDLVTCSLGTLVIRRFANARTVCRAGLRQMLTLRLSSILRCHSWALEGAGSDRLARPAFPPAEGMGLRWSVLDLTGAAASRLVCGSASCRVVMTIVLAALAVISWAMRPPSRTMGILFPPALFRRKKEA